MMLIISTLCYLILTKEIIPDIIKMFKIFQIIIKLKKIQKLTLKLKNNLIRTVLKERRGLFINLVKILEINYSIYKSY